MQQIRTYKRSVIVGRVTVPPWKKQVLRFAQTWVSKGGLLGLTALWDKYEYTLGCSVTNTFKTGIAPESAGHTNVIEE